MKQKMGLPGSKHSRPPPDDEDDSETEIIESSLSGEASEETDAADTLPCENTVLLENTVPLEDTAVLENTALLETEVVDDDKNQEKGLLLKGSNRVNDAENASDLERDTERNTQLLEDFQDDNVISGSRDKTHVHIVADSDEGGGETEVLSEDDDASDGRSTPRIVDKNTQTHSSNMGKKTSFNSADTHIELEQRAVVDSDASTEDETDVGDLQQHRGLYASGCGEAIDKCGLPQKSIQDKNQLDDSLVLLPDPHQVKENDSYKSTSILVSDGLKFPKASQGGSSSSQMETVPTSNMISRGNSSDISLGSVPRSRNIASVRAASLRASGLRASEMLNKTKEVTGIEGCKTIHSSYPNSRGESLKARRLFSDTEDMEVDKLETKDDKSSSINGNEEDDAQGVKDGKDDEQMATVGNEKDYKQSSAVVDKHYAGPNIKCKIEKDCNPRKQASNTLNSQQHNSIGIHDLCFDKRSEPCSTNTGLSYLGSEDPGEQSQADALNMVDKLVWLNTTGFSQDQEPTKLPLMTCSGLSKTKGPQNLAHLVESKSPNEKIGIFDWVDIENNKDRGQFFNDNGSSVLMSTGAADKVVSKQTKRRSYKGKHGSSVLNTKANKTGKDASKILLQGLQKFASSGSCKFGSDDRENKLHSVDNVTFSDRLEPGEDANHDNKQTGPADKLRATVEKLNLNYVEASDIEDRHTQCSNALDLSGIGNDTQLAAEAMQIMRFETSPNQVTEEKTHLLAERKVTKLRESKNINGTNLGGPTYEALEGHDSRKRTLPNTDHESLENYEKKLKTSKNSVASRRSRRVHCAEDEGKLQNKHEVKKHARLTKSKQNGKEELEPNADNMGSENLEENQDVVKKVRGRRSKGSNPEQKSISDGEILSAGGKARVGRITRQTRKLNQGETHETETSSKNSGADEEVIFEDSAKIAKGKEKLATDDLEKNAGRAQPVGKTLEGMQPNKDISGVHYNRQMKRNNAEKQKPETCSKTKSPKKEELQNAATIVKRKRKQEPLQDTQYEQGVSTRQSSKSQPTKEVKSTGEHAEENVNLSKNPETHYESGDTLPNFAKAVRTKRAKTNKERSSFKPDQSISIDGLCADTSDQEMHHKVGETALHIMRQSMRISRPESTPTFALTAIDGDKSALNDTAPQLGVQGRKSNRRSSRITTPHALKLPNHGNVPCADKCEINLNDISVDVRSPATCQTPQNANFKSPTSAVLGNKTTHNSICELQRKRTPKSTLKRELVRLTAKETSLSPILKDSARKRRESGSICVLFSHSLDDDIVKQQKKILTKLGGQSTTSPIDCTHFVTDKFVRTRNMLETMVSGKPVVTHLWLKNCGQASYFIDEKNYILRDDKKEKELGFSMPASLASAQQKPLLEGKQVFVTPNTNPDQEIIISFVKAAKGQVLNGLKGAFIKKEKNIESVIVISCEEDYEICVPFLEKGARIYSPEFLLNGIVIQRLDSSRDQLFADHVKRMRASNMRLR